ncbi:MAG: UDP-3-O-(3-hydroxymyristoyl)glucosamine N-acyltransferase [Saprospiraceae bacterium]|nr:UDP-3-O-(3-hydroxymyristoyl)glucosamine N-acyltransferase [Saprospiraceae bacterium]
MKLPTPIPVRQLADQVGAQLIGDDSLMITGVNEIHKVQPGDLTFSDVEKYFNKSLQSAATVIVLNKPAECPPGKAILVCDNPFEVYESLIAQHSPAARLTASIDPDADIHPDAQIEPGVVIGPEVTIGADTIIEANVVIRTQTTIGRRVQIQSGTVIGSDAFYFKKQDERYRKWTSGGRVVIGDDVYIGANCTINRGVSGDTVIGRGTKIDCLVHIAHGVEIGEDCIIAGQVGISGKTIVGDRCTIYGQVGIAPSLRIGDDVVIHPKSGVGEDLEGNKRYFGAPALEARAKWREIAALKQLPDLVRKLT